MKHPQYLTHEGQIELEKQIKALHQELLELGAKKKDIMETGGDGWHDNAAYDDLLDRERLLHKRLEELAGIHEGSEILTASDGDSGIVGVGTRVEVCTVDGTHRVLHITDPFNINPAEGKISYESVLGKMLMGRKVGETISLHNGVSYTVVKITI